MRKFCVTLAVIVIPLFFSISLRGAENAKFYIDGQVHPAYSIQIFINGNKVKEYFNDDETVKVFLFEFDKGLIIQGENSVEVVYTVEREVSADVPSTRSYRFNIRYQSDPMNTETSEKLYKAKGPKAPFPPVGTQQKKSDTFIFNTK